MHKPFSFVPSETYAVVTVGKYGALLTEEKTEPGHCLFLTVVCNVFRETTPTEFGKKFGRKLGR
jgi:hypothetical protein